LAKPGPVGASGLLELIIRFGDAGYVALVKIDDDRHVSIVAVRHQHQDDYLRLSLGW
jgi:hypothetical protein